MQGFLLAVDMFALDEIGKKEQQACTNLVSLVKH